VEVGWVIGPNVPVQREYSEAMSGRILEHIHIPGTTPFDGEEAKKGYRLNKMCFSFNDEANRVAFLADPEGYMRRYELTDEQIAAVLSLQVLDMLAVGGNAYYLAKLAGIYHLDMQDIGAQQTGMTKDEFKAKLRAAGEN
jgi:protocatechuate 4,5-dioxygenase alpha chain